MKKLNIQNESGRSMVEMLGVLAIIGVLSVGGIAGYTTAMRSHRANEIVNACSLLYVVANTKNESGDITYKSVFGSLPTGVSELKYNNGTITANITDAAVCTEVKNKLKVSGECSALTVTLGEVTATTTPSETTPSEFTECTSNSDCSGGRLCNEYNKVCYCDPWEYSWNGTECIPNNETECTPGYYRCTYTAEYNWTIVNCNSNGHWEYSGSTYGCKCKDHLPHSTMEEAATDCGEV